jgi:hypothetical protein
MKDLISYYLLNMPKPLIAIGFVFLVLLILICYSAAKETRKGNRHGG